MDLSKITDVKELKAMAYDQLLQREQADNNLRVINQRLAELEQGTAENGQASPAKASK